MLSDLSVDKFLADKPLALTISGLEEMKAHILGRLAVFDAGPHDFISAALQAKAEGQRQPRANGVGVIQIRGTISQHADGDISSLLMGGTSTESVAEALDTFLADDTVGKIVLDIDSPGGSVNGVTELASKIYKARGKKPIVAVANSLAASAAYWIGSAASEFYVSPSGMVGSIGVIAEHHDVSKMAEEKGVRTTLIRAGKYKATGNQYEPLDEESHARIQTRIDSYYSKFVHDVARGRGVTDASVRNGYGEGDVLTAEAALSAGMVDGIATYEQVRDRPARSQASSEDLAAREASLEIEASEQAQRLDEQIAEREAGRQRLASLNWRQLQDRAAPHRAVVEV